MDGAREMMRGIEKADSVAMDAHKLLYVPNSLGICVFKNVDDSRFLYHTSTTSSARVLWTRAGYHRRLAAFFLSQPWAAIKICGRIGYKLLFDHASDLQNTFVKFIERDPLFELMNKPELFIVNYRFVPEELGSLMNTLNEESGKNSSASPPSTG